MNSFSFKKKKEKYVEEEDYITNSNVCEIEGPSQSLKNRKMNS